MSAGIEPRSSVLDDVSGAAAILKTLANLLGIQGTLIDVVINFFNSPNFPPSININTPNTGDIFGPNDPVTLTANAYDLEDGDPAEGLLQVSWSSDVDGNLGSGPTPEPRTLGSHGPGMRTITAVATDSAGATGSDYRVINTIVGNGPTPHSDYDAGRHRYHLRRTSNQCRGRGDRRFLSAKYSLRDHRVLVLVDEQHRRCVCQSARLRHHRQLRRHRLSTF